MANDRQIGGATYTNDDERFAAIERAMQENDYAEHGLVEVLITAQKAFGYLTEDILTFVAEKLRVPPSRVWSVVTFYDMFKLGGTSTTECHICNGPTCSAARAGEILAAVCHHAGISQPGQTSADGRFTVKESACLGLCDQAPAALVNDKALVKLTPDDAVAILEGKGQPPVVQISGEPRILTGPIGRIAPLDLDAHRAEGAFTALQKALFEVTPEQIIAEVKESRLTGRGGAGFLTGLKWQLGYDTPDMQKYVVCNFDESEPGTFKDRALMEGNPFRVIEGLIISAYAIGAIKGFIFARGE
ncbi:MAG: NAD(P)H-dependent oxidoreductase subunit E [Anaerolineales bacterium]|nr:NAD(P)H-dependent oxidoreductase subunit E [Anaerolineales bacterium]